MAKRFKEPIFYPAKGDYYHCELINANPFVKVKAENGEEITTQLVGSYNFENIAVALCIGKFFGVKSQDANNAVAGYAPSNMRSQKIEKGTNTIILDAYNANPSSMQAAIENLAAMHKEKKIAIVGDMFELEDEAQAEHRLLGRLLKAKQFDAVYLCGKLSRFAKEECASAKYFETKDALVQELKQNQLKDATILVKASRGVGLETLLDVL
ncbi:MAG: glutamate ligase domain-containing protein [Flammeovirgaceae bacterium]